MERPTMIMYGIDNIRDLFGSEDADVEREEQPDLSVGHDRARGDGDDDGVMMFNER